MTTEKKKGQLTATISLSPENKAKLKAHATQMGTSLSALLVTSALKACSEANFKQLIIDLNKDDRYILLPAWMKAVDLEKAAKVLEVMEGELKD